MEFTGAQYGVFRKKALKKLTELAIRDEASDIDNSIVDETYSKLLSHFKQKSDIEKANKINLKEYETLEAFCDCTKQTFYDEKLLIKTFEKLKEYFLNIKDQTFSDGKFRFFKEILPCLNITKKLTMSLVEISEKFECKYQKEVEDVIKSFTDKIDSFDFFEFSSHFVMIGYLEGIKTKPEFFIKTSERFDIFLKLFFFLKSNNFLMDEENYVLMVQNRNHKFLLEKTEFKFHLNFSYIFYLMKLSEIMFSIVLKIVCKKEKSLLELIEKITLLCTTQAALKDFYIRGNSTIILNLTDFEKKMIRTISEIALKTFHYINNDEFNTFFISSKKHDLINSTKSFLLQCISFSLFCNQIDDSVCIQLFDDLIENTDLIFNPEIGLSVIQLGSFLVYKNEKVGALLNRSYSFLVSNSLFLSSYCQKASKWIGYINRFMSQDVVVTNIYTLSNLLFINKTKNLETPTTDEQNISKDDTVFMNDDSFGKSCSYFTSTILLDLNKKKNYYEISDDDYRVICQNSLTSIISIINAYNDKKVTVLAFTILSQKAKINSSIFDFVIDGLISFACMLPKTEFIFFLNFLHNLSLDAYRLNDIILLNKLIDAKIKLSKLVKKEKKFFDTYIIDLFQTIINNGYFQENINNKSLSKANDVTNIIGICLKPLASLLSDYSKNEDPIKFHDSTINNLFRNVWFNMVIHGFSMNSEITKKYFYELSIIAYNTPPLASEKSFDYSEISLELNTILKRRSSIDVINDHKGTLENILKYDRISSNSKLIFLSATVFIESLRVISGDCSTILYYFSDSSIEVENISKHINKISNKICNDYIHLVHLGPKNRFTYDKISQQLTLILSLYCHKVESLQNSALKCCDNLIKNVPFSLCHKKSLFTLFDLLTVLFNSIVDIDRCKYEPKILYYIPTIDKNISLLDSLKWRTKTLNNLYYYSKIWIEIILLKCQIDVKSLVQIYVTKLNSNIKDEIQFGTSFALEMVGKILSNDRELISIPKNKFNLNTLPLFISKLNWRSDFALESINKFIFEIFKDVSGVYNEIKLKIKNYKEILKKSNSLSIDEVIQLLNGITFLILYFKVNDNDLLRNLVKLPFQLFDVDVINAAIENWIFIMKDQPVYSILILSEIAKRWKISIKMRLGFYTKDFDLQNPEYSSMDYNKSNYEAVKKNNDMIYLKFSPHLKIIKFFNSSFELNMNQSSHLISIFTDFVIIGLKSLNFASLHIYAKIPRFELIRFAIDILNYHRKINSSIVITLTKLILNSSLSWFKKKHRYPFGSNVLKSKAEYALLSEILRLSIHISTHNIQILENKKKLLLFFLDDELNKLSIWLNPLKLNEKKVFNLKESNIVSYLKVAYEIDPLLCINLAQRYKIKNFSKLFYLLAKKKLFFSIFYPKALEYLLQNEENEFLNSHLLLFWELSSPIDSINMFSHSYTNNGNMIQYLMNSLLHSDLDSLLFYVPQIVQSLKFDSKKYVQSFIIEKSKISKLFSHQIIWNIKANSYKDDDSIEPDPLKPLFDDVVTKIINGFTEEDKIFYKKEFSFLNDVTNISEKLKPFIKKSKIEKKKKIEIELSKIKIKSDVYLPSCPDCTVIGIKSKSGKPLQSHAKAPFMATFILKQNSNQDNKSTDIDNQTLEKHHSVIFKVGDDCRQDILATQLISVFKTIWEYSGIDLFVFPYKITATSAGCGIIDVLPNTISRDMLGREAVNGLYEYFVTKFGPENSFEFQKAKNNFLKSLAAYSIISYLLQFKDRHNGNIMYDDQGHILHIDFGFCFDIVPGGVKFEAVPFKLTHEMVMVLGGKSITQAFIYFEELFIKGFLCCRLNMDLILKCVFPMLKSGLPCFKSNTMKKLKSRFVPNKSEKDASIFMRGLIRKSMESLYTKGYDEFQRLTNGIPY